MAEAKARAENGLPDQVFLTFLANTSDIMYVVDQDLVCLTASASFVRYLGLKSIDEVVGKTIFEIIPDQAQAKKYADDSLTVLRTGEDMLDFVESVRDHDGRTRHALCSKYAVRDEAGRAMAVLYVSHDMTREFEVNEDYWQAAQLLLNVGDDEYGAWMFDITSWRVVQARTGVNAPHIIDAHDTIDAYLASAIGAVADNEEVLRFFNDFSLEYLRAIYKSGARREDFEYRRAMEDGSRRWVRLTVRLMIDPINDHLMTIITLSDIDNIKNAQSELVKAAQIDSMTGLLNHDATFSHIARFIAGEGAEGTHALLMVDRDNLKGINDHLGHQAGDEIIVETAKALRSIFRDDDIIGRVGGDEFLILVKNAGKPHALRRKATELLQALQFIFRTPEGTLESTGSIGISFYRGGGKTMDKLYAEADTALYQSKADGRNRYTIFDQESGEAPAVEEQDALMASVNLRTLLNSIDGGIAILHTEAGRELVPAFLSDSFLSMLGGLTLEEAYAKSAAGILSCIHPDDRERVRTEYAAAMADGHTLRTTYRLIGKDDTYHWMSVGMNIVANPDGKTDVYAVHTNIEKLMHQEAKLALNEQRYRMAFSQTARLLFELDVRCATITFYTNGEAAFAPETTLEGMPEAVIASGLIHEDSADAFRAFYQGMTTGRKEGKGLFKCRYVSTGQYGWATLSYQTIFDGQGMPEKAIGSAEELPGITGRQTRLEREELLMEAVRDDQLFTMKANLSQDAVVYSFCEADDCFAPLDKSSYTAFTEAVVGTTSYSEDAMLLRLRLSRENMTENYAKGTRWTFVEYRRLDGGEIRWTKISVCIIEDPVQKELCAFWYVSDVEKRRSVEAVLPVATERDPVTHLYAQSTFDRLVNSLMRGAGASLHLYALAVIRILGMPAMGARIGVESMEMEQMYLGRFLCALLDGDCILSRYSDDSFAVFCADAQSDAWMRTKIENAIFRVGKMRSDNKSEITLKLVCGIATENARSADLAGMLSQAMRICDACQDTGTDRVHTFADYVDSFRVTEELLARTTFAPVEQEELTRPLFGAEKNAVADCMRAMLAADDYDASISGALGALGQYYGAQRVYTLSLLNASNAVSAQHEWVALGKHSILRQLAGTALEKMPMLKRVLTAAKPIVMNNQGVGRRSEAAADEAPWCFIILPIIIENKVQGFLCIENPVLHKTDVALPYALLPIILHERARFGLNAPGMAIAGRDELTGLPDRAAFNSVMQSFNPDAYHAAGAICISASGLHELNRTKGVAFGDDLLVFAAQTLRDIFKKDQVFRITGTDFAVICTNLANEAFQGQLMRAQSILQRRYPKRFVFGHAWSDKGESARKLMSRAEELARNGMPVPAILERMGREDGSLSEIKSALRNGRFFILLQPQVDMRTRKVVGAEALARYRNKAGQIVLPSEFIAAMEKAGNIRELDYFSLNQAFLTIQNWIADGVAPIPIAINFSRHTLLSSSALASILAIQSRYEVPEDFVEIEVTESVDDYETAAVQQAMESIRGQSFRFALDDLGSEYSSLKTMGDHAFDTIKIDKSLIDGFLYNSMSRSIVESIVGVCAKNGVKCIAEGVQSEEHAAALLEAGCIYAQGYFYGKPMPVEDFTGRFLKKR
ncbi:MAG: EAL domain-containing protein [Clostridia bacterium]|nr:EAL domain-containing protein [Clostridia bacterium]